MQPAKNIKAQTHSVFTPSLNEYVLFGPDDQAKQRAA